MSSEPDCSVILVDWNCGEDLARSVAAIDAAAAGLEVEIIVVDNGSADGSAGEVARRFAGVRLVATGRNLGFAAGANLGARNARGRHLVFLNPDAFLEPGALAALVSFLDTTPAVAGAALLDPDGSAQPSWGRFGPVGHLLLDTRFPRWLEARRAGSAPRRVDWVYGTCLALPRHLYAALGGFDESHFMYGEDLDLCYRARAAGFPTVWLPAARARHLGNRSGARRFGGAREAEVVRGEMRFYARRGPAVLRTFRVLAGAKFALKACLCLLVLAPARAAAYARVVGACLFFRPVPGAGAGTGGARPGGGACPEKPIQRL